MYSRNDPRFRRRLNQLSQNIESANETAQAGIFTFSQQYITPCFHSVGNCFASCTNACFPRPDERRRRQRGRSRGRAELNFDFYDDWEEEENDALLGWGNDEFDRLLGGSSAYTATEPGRQRAMSYGTKGKDHKFPAGRRKSAVQPHDGGPDPTIIPNTTYLGFLGRMPWKIFGGKGLRYKPSAADLQEHPGATRRVHVDEEPLIEESDEEDTSRRRKHRRNRSDTQASGHTTDSFSSRGDIFPSEDEDDAVPLDDSFAMVLQRTTTSEDLANGKPKTQKRPSNSRLSTRTGSSQSTRQSSKKGRRASASTPKSNRSEPTSDRVPTLSELKQEEEQIQREEEEIINKKRTAARHLASQRGLSSTTVTTIESDKSGTIPFPPFNLAQGPESTPDVVSPAEMEEQEPFSPTQVAETTEVLPLEEGAQALQGPAPESELQEPLNVPAEQDGNAEFKAAQLPFFGR